LKLAAGRGRDESEIIEFIRANPERAEVIRGHLAGVHDQYVTEFDRLLARASEHEDN